jgi:hypothetical protein
MREPQSTPWTLLAVAALVTVAALAIAFATGGASGGPHHVIAAEMNKRTLPNLYNQRPAWLDNAHAVLDVAVFASYGWSESPTQLSDQEILGRLLALNLEREPA